LVSEQAEGEELDRRGVRQWERGLWVRAGAVQERENVGSVGWGEYPGDEFEDGVEVRIRNEFGRGQD
jgi:hypothetical protein